MPQVVGAIAEALIIAGEWVGVPIGLQTATFVAQVALAAAVSATSTALLKSSRPDSGALISQTPPQIGFSP